MTRPRPGPSAMSPVPRLHAMLAEACFGRAPGFEQDLRGYLARLELDAEDAEAILAAPRRLGLYRKLIRHNVEQVTRAMLERTRARLEARRAGSFEDALAAFLEEVGPQTPHLRDVPSEFLAYAAPRWAGDASLPAWIAPYAELELVEFTIGVAPRPAAPSPLADVSADRPLVFAEPHVLLRSAWALHEASSDDLAAEPAKRDVALLVYRDAEHRTRFLELTPLAAAILERLLAGAPLGAAMVEACQVTGDVLGQDVLAGAAHLLADLGERGVLLGAREVSGSD